MAEASSSSNKSILDSLKIFAVVPAAGQGERIGFRTPKQYISVCGKPLVEHCLQALSNPSWIQRIVVVVDCDKNFRQHVDLQELPKVVPVEGKEGSRHRSIFEGLKSMENNPPDVVVIHDGARPIVPLEILSQVILKAHEVGAAGVVRPLVSTVILPDSYNKLEKCLQRASYRNSEMPQAFNYNIILQAYKNCSQDDLDYGTECLAIAKTYSGIDAYLVEGTSNLWKVTYPQDIEIARIILPKHCTKVNILCMKCPTLGNNDSTTSSLSSDTHADVWKAWTEEATEISLERALSLLEEKRINFQGYGEQKNNILLCENSSETLIDISNDILSYSLSVKLITAVEHLQPDCRYIMTINCIKSFSEAKNILLFLKHNLKYKKYSVLAIFNTVDDTISPEAEFLPLRQTVVNMFSDCNVLTIVCQRDCTKQSFNTHQKSRRNYSKTQLGLIIEQSLKSTLLHSLHGQVLFL